MNLEILRAKAIEQRNLLNENNKYLRRIMHSFNSDLENLPPTEDDKTISPSNGTLIDLSTHLESIADLAYTQTELLKKLDHGLFTYGSGEEAMPPKGR